MRLRYLIVKEFKQMLRNWLLPVVFLLLPLALTNMVPRIATQEIKGLRFCVIDHDHSTLSSRFIQQIDASVWLDLSGIAASEREAMRMLDTAEADLFIEIPRGYERSVRRGEQNEKPIYVAANATNGMKGVMGLSYVQQILAGSTPQVRYAFNQYLDYKIYMIPAVFALMLTLIVGFLPALNIVGEKERGTIEQVNVTPISRWEFILSKMIPYWCVGMVMSLITLVMAKVLFGILPAGSIAVLILFLLVFCVLISSFALIISNYSSSVQQASLTMFFFLVIFILMSGLLTPIRSMPQWAQTLTLLDPMRHIIDALRLIYIKGPSFAEMLPQFYMLATFATVISLWTVLSYRKNN